MSQIRSTNLTDAVIEQGYRAGDLYTDEYRGHHPSTADPDDFRSEPASCPTQHHNVGDSERVLSVAAGTALALMGLMRGRLSGLALAAMGGSLVWRGYSGHCYCYDALGISTAKRGRYTAVPAKQGVKLEKTIVIDCSQEDLYRFWRRFENLPQVMRHLKDVRSIDCLHSRWVAEGAAGKDVKWDAEIINERPDEMISWRSLPGGDVDTAGSIRFRRLPHDHATEVTISMKYNPPAGKIGAQIATLLGEGLEAKLDDDLESFKQVMETGMAPIPSVG
jgi:uncharacterized membrane protein